MKLKLLLACSIAGSLLAADQKWTRKEYTEWTPAQIEQVLNDSAWARHVAAFIGTTDEDPRTYPAKGPTAGDIGLGGPRSTDDWFPVGKLPSTKMPTLPVTVRWDSALPVREALVRSHSAEARDTENTLATRDKYYVLTILGLGTAGNSDKTMLRQGLLNEARLMRHGKKPIMPEDARIDEKTGTIQIFFPKTDPITLDDKEVAFGTVFGTVQVIQRFRLKDMVYKGKLEL